MLYPKINKHSCRGAFNTSRTETLYILTTIGSFVSLLASLYLTIV